MDDSSENLRARLERLERQNAIHKFGWAALLLASTFAVLSGADPSGKSQVVEAQSFVAKDKAGKVRATFGVDDEGSAGLKILDPDGVLRLKALHKLQGLTGISLHDRKGRKSFGVVFGPDGDGSIAFSDPTGAERLTVGNGPDGSIGMNVRDQGGKIRAAIGTNANGSAWISLLGSPEGSIMLGMNPDGSGMIHLRGRRKESRIGLEVTDAGVFQFGIVGEDGKHRAVIFSSPDGKVGLNLGAEGKNPRIGFFVGEDFPSQFLLADGDGKARITFGVDNQNNANIILFDDKGEARQLNEETSEPPK